MDQRLSKSPTPQKLGGEDITKPRAPRFQRRARVNPPELTSPLSELTRHLTHIPIRDMENWVHRSIDVRLHQVSKMRGRIARPMNCFMLYRSAYAERTKEWVSETNHKVVSQLAGKSWKLETVEIRKKYVFLAEIERNNHMEAHPGYKFVPKVKNKRVKEEDKQSPSIRQSSISFSSPALNQNHMMNSMEFDSEWQSHASAPLSVVEHGLPMNYVNSVWPMKKLDGLSPETIQTAELSHCLQQLLNPQYPEGPPIEDVGLSRFELQDLLGSSSMDFVGLPGATSQDLLQLQSPALQPVFIDSTVNPQLLDLYSYPSIGRVYSSSKEPVWQEVPTSSGFPPATKDLPAPDSTTDIGLEKSTKGGKLPGSFS